MNSPFLTAICFIYAGLISSLAMAQDVRQPRPRVSPVPVIGEPKLELVIGDPINGPDSWVVGREEKIRVMLQQQFGRQARPMAFNDAVELSASSALTIGRDEGSFRANGMAQRYFTITPNKEGECTFTMSIPKLGVSSEKVINVQSSKFDSIGGFPNERILELTNKGTDPYIFTSSYRGKNRGGDKAGVYNGTCWAAPLNFKGIAWDRATAGTVITRRHIVSAAHWGNHLPSEVVFETIDDSGKPVSLNIRLEEADKSKYPDFSIADPDWGSAHWVNIGNDIAIATLAEPLPYSIPVYCLPAPVTLNVAKAQLTGRSVVSATWSNDNKQPDPKGHRIVGAKCVANISDTNINFKTDLRLNDALFFSAVFGDSGHPLFFLNPSTDDLILASTYTGGGGGSGPYYGSSKIQENLKKAISNSPAPEEKLSLYDMEKGVVAR